VGAKAKRWQAAICYNAKTHHLGHFDTRQEAALAYDKAARQEGTGKPLNFKSLEEAEEAAAQAIAELGPLRLRPRPQSGFYGVTLKGTRWQARIQYGGKKHILGMFDTKEEGALAYDRAARAHSKEKLQGDPLNYETIKMAEEAAAQAKAEHRPKPQRPRPPSGFYGVTAKQKKWKAQIRYGGKKVNLGSFKTKQEAALSYDRAAREHAREKPLNYESIVLAIEAAAQAAADFLHGTSTAEA
jgi:hypothetical protein